MRSRTTASSSSRRTRIWATGNSDITNDITIDLSGKRTRGAPRATRYGPAQGAGDYLPIEPFELPAVLDFGGLARLREFKRSATVGADLADVISPQMADAWQVSPVQSTSGAHTDLARVHAVDGESSAGVACDIAVEGDGQVFRAHDVEGAGRFFAGFDAC